jgi:hypothetical protein
VVYNGFFKFAASPSGVADENNQSSHECLLAVFSASRDSHFSPNPNLLTASTFLNVYVENGNVMVYTRRAALKVHVKLFL